MTTLDHVGDGGVFTTVEDLFLWDQAFYNFKLGKELMEIIQVPGVLNNGEKLEDAFGLEVDEYRGLKRVSYSGEWAGFRAQMARFPEQKFTVICLANLGTINPSRLCMQIADIYLTDEFKKPEKAPKIKIEPITLSKEELVDKVGNYQNKKSGAWFIISVKEDKLTLEAWGEKFVLTPLSKTSFQALDAPYSLSIDFLPDEIGKIHKAKLTVEKEEINLAKAPQLRPLIASQLKEYAGVYYNDELPVTYKLVVAKDSLIFKHKNAPQDALKHMDRDKFTVGWFDIEFVRNKRKKVTGFVLGAGRAANIEFLKK
jgi:hypothetical protein